MDVRQFGSLVQGVTHDPSAIATNTNTIQIAIDVIGSEGGGEVFIPAGVYQISPPNLTTGFPASLVIDYDNITLIGEGIGRTILQSRGDWQLNSGQVMRGFGILIKGTDNPDQPRRNITIKNLELSGGTNGFTGSRGFPANPETGDGWDMSHKGIALDFNKSLDNITFDSIYVHDFRGEVIYGGGNGIGKVTLRNSKLSHSNASMLSLDADLAVVDCEFFQTATAWVENAPIAPHKSYLFQNCTFRDSTCHGLVIAQGNFPGEHRKIVTDCVFINSLAGVCAFGGVSDLLIKNNIFIDCDAPLFTSEENRNIRFLQNRIEGRSRPVSTANLLGKLNNVLIEDNQQISNENLGKISCLFYFGDLTDVVIRNNTFYNCRTPEQTAPVSRERPLFQNNRYVSSERRELQGKIYFSQLPPYIVEPKFEEVIVQNCTSDPLIEISMNTDCYAEGQQVRMTGGTTNQQIKIPANSDSIQCNAVRFLGGNETLVLEFKQFDRRWHEVLYLTP